MHPKGTCAPKRRRHTLRQEFVKLTWTKLSPGIGVMLLLSITILIAYNIQSRIMKGDEPNISVILSAKSIIDALSLLHRIPHYQRNFVVAICLSLTENMRTKNALVHFSKELKTMGFVNIKAFAIKPGQSSVCESWFSSPRIPHFKFMIHFGKVENHIISIDLKFASLICSDPNVLGVSFVPLQDSLYSYPVPMFTAEAFYWHIEPTFTALFICKWADFERTSSSLTVLDPPPIMRAKGRVAAWKSKLISFAVKNNLKTLYPKTEDIITSIRTDYSQREFLLKGIMTSSQHLDVSQILEFPSYNLFGQKLSKVHSKSLVSMVTTLPPYGTYDLPRREELINTLRINLQNKFIDKIYIFEEKCRANSYYEHLMPYLDSKKVAWTFVDHQMTYQELLQFTNTHLLGHLVILTHSDIYFDWTISCSRALENEKILLALSRQPTPYCPDGSLGGRSQTGDRLAINFCQDYVGSHDAFIFKSPLLTDLDFLNILPNSFGAENMLVYSAKFANYTVLNPCMDIVAMHFHCDSSVRNNKTVASHDKTHLIHSRFTYPPPYDLYAYPVRLSFCQNYYF